jgi:hypothetical protein
LGIDVYIIALYIKEQYKISDNINIKDIPIWLKRPHENNMFLRLFVGSLGCDPDVMIPGKSKVHIV